MEDEVAQLSLTGAGVFAAVCTLAGAVIAQLFNMRKTVLSLLITRVTNLEIQLEVERQRCDEKFTLERTLFEERMTTYRKELREQDALRFDDLIKAIRARGADREIA